MAINEDVYKKLGLKGFLGALPKRIYDHLGSLGYVGTISDRLFREGGYLSYITNLLGVVSRYFVTLDPVLNSYYEMAAPITFTGDFEIEVEYSSSSTADWQALVGNDTTTDGIQFTNLDKIRVRPFDVIFTPTIPRDGSLRKLKITRNGTLLSLFLDGVSLDTAVVSSNLNMVVTHLGALLNNNYFDGIIANAKFTDKSGASDVVTTFKLDNSPAAANYVYGTELLDNNTFPGNANARQYLVSTKGWIITDGGSA